jgi:hypothetical protein
MDRLNTGLVWYLDPTVYTKLADLKIYGTFMYCAPLVQTSVQEISIWGKGDGTPCAVINQLYNWLLED